VANYTAVAEAMRIAGKQTSLLREVMKIRAESALPASPSKTATSNIGSKAKPPKK
jgi:hypothetical protein